MLYALLRKKLHRALEKKGVQPSTIRSFTPLLAFAVTGTTLASVALWTKLGLKDPLPLAVLVTATGILAAAAVSYVWVVLPVRSMLHVLQDIKRDNFLTRTLVEGQDEIGMLGVAINEVADRLAHREDRLSKTLVALDIAYRLARVAGNSFDEQSAKDGICNILRDAYPGMHASFQSGEADPPADLLVQSAITQGRLLHGANPNAWEAAVPVHMGSYKVEALYLCTAADNAHPDDDTLASVGSYVAMVIAAATNYQRATMDGLTGLYNKQHGKEWLDHSCLEALRYGHPLSILVLDIDHFKRVNDTYGHSTGDIVLKAVAHTVHALVRQADVPVRNGGEEFFVLLPHTTAAQAWVLGEKVRSAVEALAVPLPAGGELRVTISVGLTELASADTPASLLDRADYALYDAKTGGRNRVTERKAGVAPTAGMPPAEAPHL